jgi:predicted transposase YdaD
MKLEEVSSMLSQNLDEWERKFENKGRLEGWQEGRQEGQQETLEEVLSNLLAERFGSEIAAVCAVQRFQNANPQQFNTCLKRILTAKTVSEVFDE